MRYLSLLFAALLLLSACRKNNNSENERDYFETFEYRPGSEIIHVPDTVPNQQFAGYTTRASNDKVAFAYRYGYTETKLADGGYSLVIGWHVPSTATSFSYKDQELATNLTYYSAGPPMVRRREEALITTGTIIGQKTGENSWKITMDIMLPKKDATLNIQHIQHTGDYTVKY